MKLRIWCELINWISNVSFDSFSNKRGFRIKAIDSCSVTKTFNSKKGAQTQTDMIVPRVTPPQRFIRVKTNLTADYQRKNPIQRHLDREKFHSAN